MDLAKLDEVVEEVGAGPGSLVPLLQRAQAVYGWLPKEVLEGIAQRTRIPVARLYGIATFYTQFRLAPVGRHIIRVCHGTACHVAGAVRITEALEEELKVHDGETTPDLRFTLDSVACLGCCSLAPVMMVDDDTHGRLTPDRARIIIHDYK